MEEAGPLREAGEASWLVSGLNRMPVCEVSLTAILVMGPSGKPNLEDCDPKHMAVYPELTTILVHTLCLALAFLSATPGR